MSSLQFVFVCHVAGDHWIICRVLTDTWTCEIYDSLLHTMPNAADRMARRVSLFPIIKLWPRVLQQIGYWQQHLDLRKQTDFLQIVWVPLDQQYIQQDDYSCGPFACMMIDRMFALKPPKLKNSLSYVSRFRAEVAKRIFSLSRRGADMG